MKAYINNNLGYYFTIISILIFIFGTGCSLTRRLKNNEALVRKVTIKGVDEEFSEAAANYIDKQEQPNNWLNLQIYYLFSRNGKKNIGDPPALLDSSLVEFSRFQMERFLQSKGYVKAKVSNSILIKKKRAEITFSAVEGPMFRIRKIEDSIADPVVRKLYKGNRSRFSHIQPGGRYDTDSLAYDRDEFFQIMKRNGYYDFLRQYISFDYDSTFMNSVVDLKMVIANPIGKNTHPLYKINNTLVTISHSTGRAIGDADTVVVDSQFRFVDYSHKFRPKTVINYIFQRKGQLFDIDKQSLTTSRLSGLNVFRNVPNPTYEKLPDSTNRLNTKIEIIPLKQMADRVEGEFLFNGGKYGYNIGNTFTDRNIFKRASILQLKVNYSVLYDNASNKANPNGIENQDFRIGGSLVYPFIMAPFKLPILGKYGVPHTTFSSNYQLYYQQGLVKRTSFINSITYDFAETANKFHLLTPISFEVSQGSINPTAKQELLNNNLFAYYKLISQAVFSSGSQYSYQYNANKLNTFSNFNYFRGSVDVGGNTLYLVSRVFNTGENSAHERTFDGRPYAQYSKGEIDFRVYKSLGGERQFIFRFNSGLGVPYGNSTELIFEKNFYSGGSNDMRAWLPRTLGPGQYNRSTYYIESVQESAKPGTPYSSILLQADTLRGRNKYLDQYGEVKIISNFEYRYKLINNFFGSKLKGAFFIDAGNIWLLHQQNDKPNVDFKFNNLWQSTAMDLGTGLRLDLSFFVFRLDAAFKFKDPQFNGSDQWVLLKHYNELFRAGAFKAKYSNDNKFQEGADSYNFMQLNFGIGMPF